MFHCLRFYERILRCWCLVLSLMILQYNFNDTQPDNILIAAGVSITLKINYNYI